MSALKGVGSVGQGVWNAASHLGAGPVGGALILGTGALTAAAAVPMALRNTSDNFRDSMEARNITPKLAQMTPLHAALVELEKEAKNLEGMSEAKLDKYKTHLDKKFDKDVKSLSRSAFGQMGRSMWVPGGAWQTAGEMQNALKRNSAREELGMPLAIPPTTAYTHPKKQKHASGEEMTPLHAALLELEKEAAAEQAAQGGYSLKESSALDTAYLALHQGMLKEAEVQELESFDSMLKGANWKTHMAQGAAVAGGAAATGLAMAGIATGINKAVDMLSYAGDFKSMMAANPDLAEYPEQEIRMVFSSLRHLNPAFSKDPLVSGTFVRGRMENRQQSSHGGFETARVELGTAKDLAQGNQFMSQAQGRDPLNEVLQNAGQMGLSHGIKGHSEDSKLYSTPAAPYQRGRPYSNIQQSQKGTFAAKQSRSTP